VLLGSLAVAALLGGCVTHDPATTGALPPTAGAPGKNIAALTGAWGAR
jgi:type IV pilus biogenesis protein CpaD/CtpE